jgi:dipeptidyl aminopeptidase/acylaminoacyl peptidase
MWYDTKARHYFAWDGSGIRNISQNIKYPLWNEEDDTPDDPGPYGVMGWGTGDSLVYLYDKYDGWEVSMSGKMQPQNIFWTGGRKDKKISRYVSIDPDKRFFRLTDTLLYRVFDEVTKKYQLVVRQLGNPVPFVGSFSLDVSVSPAPIMASCTGEKKFIYTRESYQYSPDLYTGYVGSTGDKEGNVDTDWIENRLSAINAQQRDYNWGTSELYKWKAFTGKMAEGVLYKPENFDPTKKYPLILYFYETHANTLHSYIPPTPTGSRLNISFFVSRGYVVFSPDIHYTVGHPAKDCYNHVVSAAQDLAKQKWIDAKNIGIQGQSWGGIQVAQLVTMTNMFKAAWAGAPVANMTSAYGGIRWESGVNRQFQYEKTQSRIGATLWEKPELYIENSPLFHLPKVTTPLVIMANDADGAVPWYQGIELFTAMRRLGKQVWMLNYNGEAHNLRERKNQKDISIREQQYFDWLLKGEKPPKWITEGVPAVKKGKDWGLELSN